MKLEEESRLRDLNVQLDLEEIMGAQREAADAQAAATNPRISLFDASTTPQTVPASIAFTNGRTMQLGAYTRQSGLQVQIQDGVTEDLFTIDTAAGLANGGPQSFMMDYTMLRDNATGRAVRTGRLTVVSSDTGDSAAAAPLTWQDDFTENMQVDMTLIVTEASGDVSVSVTSSATGEDGTIYYSITYLA